MPTHLGDINMFLNSYDHPLHTYSKATTTNSVVGGVCTRQETTWISSYSMTIF